GGGEGGGGGARAAAESGTVGRGGGPPAAVIPSVGLAGMASCLFGARLGTQAPFGNRGPAYTISVPQLSSAPGRAMRFPPIRSEFHALLKKGSFGLRSVSCLRRDRRRGFALHSRE